MAKSGLAIGRIAPALKAHKFLRYPSYEEGSLSLGGKPAILLFWMPGDEGCRHSINLLNALHPAIEKCGVTLVAVTRENENLVRAVLQKRPIVGWVALDYEGAAFKAFEADALPHVVLVDSDGKLAAVGDPRDLTESMIVDLAKSKKVELPPKKKPEKPPAEPPKIDPIYEVTIFPSRLPGVGPEFHLNYEKGRLVGKLVPLPLIIAQAYGTRPARLYAQESLPLDRYDYSIRHPSHDEETVREVFRQAVCDAFEIDCAFVKAEVHLLRLRRRKGAADLPEPPASAPTQKLIVLPRKGGPSSISKVQQGQKDAGREMTLPGGAIAMYGTNMRRLAKKLEDLLGTPVVNETDMLGEYDIQLSIARDDTRSVETALRDIGLELVKDTGRIQVLRIEKRKR